MLIDDLVTTKQAAELLKVSPWTISAWLSQGKLPRMKAGGRTLISKADLDSFVRRSSGLDMEPPKQRKENATEYTGCTS